jgi:hypothetical protein
MNFQAIGDFTVKIAPYLVALLIAVGSWIWGRSALKAKDEAMGSKDELVRDLRAQIGSVRELGEEVKKAKEEHIRTLEQLRPARLTEDLKALHDYYGQAIDLIKKAADERQAELTQKHNPEQRERLEHEIADLRVKLAAAEAGREAAELLARTDRTFLYPQSLYSLGLDTGVEFKIHTTPDIAAYTSRSILGEVFTLTGTPSEPPTTEDGVSQIPEPESKNKAESDKVEPS